MVPPFIDLKKSMPPTKITSLLLGSTAMVRLYHAWPLEKSVAGVPLSASTGSVFAVKLTPPSILNAIPFTALADSHNTYT